MSRKQKPAYNLETARDLAAKEKTRLISLGAKKDAHGLGYSDAELIDFFMTLEKKDFLKSETDFRNHKIWQDYYLKSNGDVNIFIKFKLIKADSMIIITSFKEDANHL